MFSLALPSFGEVPMVEGAPPNVFNGFGGRSERTKPLKRFRDPQQRTTPVD
jgi:hypothetical protein